MMIAAAMLIGAQVAAVVPAHALMGHDPVQVASPDFHAGGGVCLVAQALSAAGIYGELSNFTNADHLSSRADGATSVLSTLHCQMQTMVEAVMVPVSLQTRLSQAVAYSAYPNANASGLVPSAQPKPPRSGR